jgi:hypothetical protein
MAAEWDIVAGSVVERPSLHARFGGNPRNRLAPSAATRNIFVFVDTAREEWGRWEDGVLQVPGERNRGGKLGRVNEAVLHHWRDGRALRVFTRDPNAVVYAGEFRLDPARPFSFADWAGAQGRPERRILFRLVPVETVAAKRRPEAAPARAPRLRWKLDLGTPAGPWPALLVASCVAVAVTTWGWTSAPVRPAVTAWFMLVCPGMALMRLLPDRGTLNRLVLAVAASLAVETVVATTMLEAKLWSPSAALAVLLCVTLAAAGGGRLRLGWVERRAT